MGRRIKIIIVILLIMGIGSIFVDWRSLFNAISLKVKPFARSVSDPKLLARIDQLCKEEESTCPKIDDPWSTYNVWSKRVIEISEKEHISCDGHSEDTTWPPIILKLAKHWEELDSLQAEIKKDPSFEETVLDSFAIGAIADEADIHHLQTIKRTAINQCPLED